MEPVSAIIGGLGQISGMVGKFADGANIDKTAAANNQNAWNTQKINDGALFNAKGFVNQKDYNNIIIILILCVVAVTIILAQK